MKVLNFLEWCKDKGSIDYYGGGIFDIIDFYSQPFKPEMITELFEGWGDVTRDWALPNTGVKDCKFYEFKKEYKHGIDFEHTTRIRMLYRSDGCLYDLHYTNDLIEIQGMGESTFKKYSLL